MKNKQWLKYDIEGCIENYSDFEEYEKFNNVTLEDFEEQQEFGFINEITCGTYNGATNEFVPWATNLDNLIDTILQDIKDCDYYEVLNDYTEEQNSLGYVLAYVEMYKVFTIGNKVYVDMD